VDVIKWLLEGEPWVEYRTRIDLLREDRGSLQVRKAYYEMLAHDKIRTLITDLTTWPGEALRSHKTSGHLLHKLTFLADLGFRDDEPQIAPILQRIKNNTAEEGPFQVMVNIPKAFGGTGDDGLSWMLCDAGSTLYALAEMGAINDLKVLSAVDYLAGLVRKTGGWPCAASSNLGKFRGPGKTDDPCPYATLLMVKALIPFGDRYKRELQQGVNTLFDLWVNRQTEKPYLFAMGSGFKKLKAPMVWYDILHVLEVLSKISDMRHMSAAEEMAKIVRDKANEAGRYRPESIWMDWRRWEFGQKREPSRWLTFLVYRILNRFDLG